MKCCPWRLVREISAFILPTSAFLVATIVRAKVMEFCAAGGVEDPEFRTVSNPEQIISEKELARLTGREERDEGKRGGAGGSGRSGHDGHGKGGKSG